MEGAWQDVCSVSESPSCADIWIDGRDLVLLEMHLDAVYTE